MDCGVNSSWPAFWLGDRLARNQHQSAANFTLPDLFEGLVDLRELPDRDFTADLFFGSHGQYFAHILSRSNGGCLDVHLRCRHLDWLKANGLRRQADNQ